MEKPSIYVDYAASTPLDERVLQTMKPYFTDNFGNSSSFHKIGMHAKEALDSARKSVATSLGARPQEIIFTSGGTEADNLAILGFARKNKEAGNHIIVSAAEHKAILEPAIALKKEGFDVTILETDAFGMVSRELVLASMRPETILVSVIYGNNEVGTLNPIQKIGAGIRKYREAQKSLYPVFHTDACQIAGTEEMNVQKINVDMMSVNGGKMSGPKGVGCLFARQGVKIEPLQYGGGQEQGRRPGTENVAAIVGFAEALHYAVQEGATEKQRLTDLRDYLVKGLKKSIPHIRLNGHPKERLANNVNLSFCDVEGEALLLYLDAEGIFASTGSACTSASLDPSHVILALGLPPEVAHSSLRMTLGRSTTKEDLDVIISVLPQVVEKLRAMSPKSGNERFYE